MKLKEILNSTTKITLEDLKHHASSIEEGVLQEIALEHKTYPRIPNTKCSYRLDPANTNTKTQKHAHVYASLDGKGGQLYSVNIDGSGHDGYHGTPIPKTHADFFNNQKGFSINNCVLESISPSTLMKNKFKLFIISE